MSLAYSLIEIIDDDNCFEYYRKNVLSSLKEVKFRMPRNNTIISNPIMKFDPIYMEPILFKSKDEIRRISNERDEISIDAYAKLKYLSIKKEESAFSSMNIDDLVDEDAKVKSSDKNMIAVVHVDGNDMGAMIMNYLDSLSGNVSFSEEIMITREISNKIDKVFKQNINTIFNSSDVKVILNSGDDITFICNALKALLIIDNIIKKIESEALYPEIVASEFKDIYMQDNKFSACAGICFCHPHFPFFMAYEIAEELCSNAKSFAKSNRIETRIKNKSAVNYCRPTSWFDFEVVPTGIIKSVDEQRNEKPYLYLRPYCFNDLDNIDYSHRYSNLKKLIIKLRDKNKLEISRGNVKEIRNTYEESRIDIDLLFKKLESRKALDNIGVEEPYCPYIKIDNIDYARYYDASVLYDLCNFDEEGEEE